jgi:hypothetical protein
MSLLIQAILLLVAAVVAVLGTREILRRVLPRIVVEHGEKVIPFVLGSFGGFYGLIAGFMLSTSWVELRALRSAMTAEVNALADMGDIAANLPEPRADQLKRAIDNYLKAVVDSELPAMAQGRTSPTTTRALTQLWYPLGPYEPSSEWEVSLREIAINKVMDIGEQRRQRIVFSRERLPSILWWILVGSGAVVLAGSCVVSLNYRRPAGFFLGSLTVVVALVLFAIRVLERPFQYNLAPESSEYMSAWEVLGGPDTPMH